MAKYDLFISYSPKDADKVRSTLGMLARQIPALSFYSEVTDDEFNDAAKAAIEQAGGVLYLQSEDSLQLPRVRKEVEYAKSLDKKVFPLLLDGAKKRGWYMFKFGSLGFVDASRPEAMEKLVADILQLKGDDEATATDAAATVEESVKNDHFNEEIEPIGAAACLPVSATEPEENIEEPQSENLPFFDYKVYADDAPENDQFIEENTTFDKDPEPAFEFVYSFEPAEACDADSDPLDDEDEDDSPTDEDEYIAADEDEYIADDEDEYIADDEDENGGPTDEYPYAHPREDAPPFSASDEYNTAPEPRSDENPPAEASDDENPPAEQPVEPQNTPQSSTHEKKDNSKMIILAIVAIYLLFNLMGGSDYDTERRYSCDRAAVEKDGKWGFIDRDDKLVVALKYDEVKNYDGGYAAVSVNGKWGFVNLAGREITPIKYDNVSSFVNGFAEVKSNGKSGIVNNVGREIVPPKYDFVSMFATELARVSLDGKWGFVNKKGEEVVPLKYDDAGSFSFGPARVKLNNKWGFIDSKGKEIVPTKYDKARDFSLYRAAVRLDGKWGFVDNKGKLKIPLKYDAVNDFKDARAAVRLNGKWGFIDIDGRVTVPIQYDRVEDFRNGEAKVFLNGKYYFVNRSGQRITN